MAKTVDVQEDVALGCSIACRTEGQENCMTYYGGSSRMSVVLVGSRRKVVLTTIRRAVLVV